MKSRVRGLRAAAVLLAAGLASAACAQMAPSIPAARPGGQGVSSGATFDGSTATGPTTPVPTVSINGAVVPSPTVQVSAEAKAVPADLGIDVFWHTNGDPKAVDSAAAKVLDYVVSLHANSIGLTFPIFVDGPKPTKFYGVDGITPRPADLARVIAAAQARGLRVLLRPLVDEANIMTSPGGWRGSIAPKDVNSFFASYRSLLAPYFALAEQDHVQEFVLGVELNSLTPYTAQWQSVVRSASAVFHGQLSYADNWSDWYSGNSPAGISDIGVDAYPRFQLDDSATMAQLVADWTAWLSHRPHSVVHKTVIQEVGIPAQAGAYPKPNNWGGADTPVVPQIQANWFAASCQSARSLGMRGIYFWMVDSNNDPANAAGYPTGSFIGRGDAAIKACFSTGWTS
jgi:hypothetical protein